MVSQYRNISVPSAADKPLGGGSIRAEVAVRCVRETRSPLLSWLIVAVATAGLAVAVWSAVTAWGGIVHGHPLYAVLLVLATLLAPVAAVLAAGGAARGRPPVASR